MAIGSAFSRVDPSHLNDTPSRQQPVWVLGRRSFSLAALIYWPSAWSPRRTSGHVGRANDEKRYGERWTRCLLWRCWSLKATSSTGGTYTTSTLSMSVGVSRRGKRGRRSALLPTTFGKTISAGCGSGGFLAAAAIAPSPARQTTPSATVHSYKTFLDCRQPQSFKTAETPLQQIFSSRLDTDGQPCLWREWLARPRCFSAMPWLRRISCTPKQRREFSAVCPG